jgi:hypothetical protein
MSIQKPVKMFDIDIGDDLPASLENDHDFFKKKDTSSRGFKAFLDAVSRVSCCIFRMLVRIRAAMTPR